MTRIRGLTITTRRKWSNPEFLIYRTGIRLEDLPETTVSAIHALLRASTSEAGYARLLAAMKTNRFLGDLCKAVGIMNERSYQCVTAILYPCIVFLVGGEGHGIWTGFALSE
jgi:hypothetical protein